MASSLSSSLDLLVYHRERCAFWRSDSSAIREMIARMQNWQGDKEVMKWWLTGYPGIHERWFSMNISTPGTWFLTRFLLVNSHQDVASTSVVPSVAVMEMAIGRGLVPSKWPQNPLASTASWKRTENIAQLIPVDSSFGIDEGSESERDVVVDMMGGGAHNLLEFYKWKAQCLWANDYY